jgi:AraC-like DNA-binding protein
MISALNQLVDLVEEHLAEELDVDKFAGALGTTEYHLRRMFSSLAGMPLSEYVRRRRMTVAAADVVRGKGICCVSPSGTDTAPARRSDARSGRSTVPAPVTCAVMEAPCAHNRSSGSA